MRIANKVVAPCRRFCKRESMLRVLLTGLLKLISWLPLPVVRGLGHLVGFVFGHVIRHHRSKAFEALARSMPELGKKERKRIINTMYQLQGINGVEMVWYSMRGLETVAKDVEIEGLENLRQALDRGKGMLGLTAHIGNFELMPMATAARGFNVSVIVKRIKNKTVNYVIGELRAHERLAFFSAKNAYRDCLKALRRNEVVGMIIDQNMTRDNGIFVDFFGKQASTSPGLAYMAAQSQAPVVPSFIYRQPNGRHTLKFFPLIEPPEARTPEAIHAATQLYTTVIEDAVREAPEQWIWMHRRWKTQLKGDHSRMVRSR